MNGGLDLATDGGTELRTQVELWRIRFFLDLGRELEPLGQYVEVLGLGCPRFGPF